MSFGRLTSKLLYDIILTANARTQIHSRKIPKYFLSRAYAPWRLIMQKKNSVILALLLLLLAAAFVCQTSAADYYVYDAVDMQGAISAGGGLKVKESLLRESDTCYVAFEAAADGIGADGTQFQLDVKNFADDFNYVDYPVIKLGYRSNIAADARIDINVGIKYLGQTTRLWGIADKYDRTYTKNSLIIDVRSRSSGGEGPASGNYSWSNLDIDAKPQYLRLKPYYQRQPIVAGERFDVEYIGYFKTVADAEAYTFSFNFDREITDFYLTEQVLRLVKGDTHSLVNTYAPLIATAPEVTYASDAPDIVEVNQNGELTAKSAGTATITATAGTFTSTCKVIVLDTALAPVEFLSREVICDKDPVVINCLGDSITTYAPAPAAGKNYHDWWGELYYVKNNDYGISGTTVSLNGTVKSPFISRYSEMSDDAELVTVKGGTNDFASTSKGTLTTRSPYTYYGSLRILVEGLIEKYPDRQIALFTPIRRCENGQTLETKNKFGDTLRDYAHAVEDIGRIYNIPVVNLYEEESLDFTGDLESDFCKKYMPDGLHPSGEGHRIMQKFMSSELERLGVIKIVTTGESEYIPLDKIERVIFDAETIKNNTTAEKCVVLNELVNEAGKSFVRIAASDYKTSDDNTQIKFSIENAGGDFKIKEYPFMVIAYKTNLQYANTWDINVVIKRNGAYSRHWGIKENPFTDGTLNYTCIPLASRINGGQVEGYTTFDDIDEDSLIKQLIFKPWGGNSKADIDGGDYTDIEYIGFFKNYTGAANFIKYEKGEIEAPVGDTNEDGKADTLDSLNMLRAASNAEGYDPAAFDSSCDFDGDGKFTAKDAIIFARHLAGWRGYEKLPLAVEDKSADHDVYSPNHNN